MQTQGKPLKKQEYAGSKGEQASKTDSVGAIETICKYLNQEGYFVIDLLLTLPSPAPTMQPESSDGFASVGTILPEERAALLPGGSFRFFGVFCDLVRPSGRPWRCPGQSIGCRKTRKARS